VSPNTDKRLNTKKALIVKLEPNKNCKKGMPVFDYKPRTYLNLDKRGFNQQIISYGFACV